MATNSDVKSGRKTRKPLQDSVRPDPVEEQAVDAEELEAGVDAALDEGLDAELGGDDVEADGAGDDLPGRVSHRDMYTAEARSVASQQLLREQMAREVEEFLARGGRINIVEPNVKSDPPVRPDPSYGNRPI